MCLHHRISTCSSSTVSFVMLPAVVKRVYHPWLNSQTQSTSPVFEAEIHCSEAPHFYLEKGTLPLRVGKDIFLFTRKIWDGIHTSLAVWDKHQCIYCMCVYYTCIKHNIWIFSFHQIMNDKSFEAKRQVRSPTENRRKSLKSRFIYFFISVPLLYPS